MNDENRNATSYATYCPEDNRLRLYVGRVPRDEYEALRKEGWVSTAKQDCDFVAVWTPDRRDTALKYGDGVIEDEDQSPAERSVQRAERFAGYRDKREGEAMGRADAYDAGPAVHGYQSQARAERMAARHDRIADKSLDAWSKAEYWTSRTAGVISHALYTSTPGVRMGRIKELELAIARHEKHEREDDWTTHYRMRLAYENQMLNAVGGRAAVVEMIVGGFYNEERIHGINRSPVTGNVTSIETFGKYHLHRAGKLVVVEGVYSQNIERDRAGFYRAPTAEELAEFHAARKAEQKARREAKKDLPPEPKLVNPTDADAERLQAVWNAADPSYARYYNDGKPSEVLRITQAQYSASLKAGSCSTKEITGGGFRLKGGYDSAELPTVAKVRSHRNRVVILTDKPQTAFDAAVWHDTRPDIIKELESHVDELRAAATASWTSEWDKPTQELIFRARQVGLFRVSSMSQYGLTATGQAWADRLKVEKLNAPAQ